MTADPQALPSHHDTMTERIRQILIETPSSRSNDKILILTYLRRYGKLAYDPSTKRLTFVNKEGLTYEEYMTQPSTESICRLKRMIQREARDRLEHGIGTKQDAEVLASDKVAEQRTILEGINRHYFYRG